MTPLDIANNALALLQEPPIDGFDPNGNDAQCMCYLHYHPVRREVLCVHPWAFARRAENIGTFATADGEHAIPHNLPPLCLRVLEVDCPGFTLRGRQLFATAKIINVRYIADVEDTELFTPGFLDLFTLRLAAVMCIPLVNSTTLRAELMAQYDTKLKSITNPTK